MGGFELKLLLDTHIWLWYVLGNEQLSPDLRSLMAQVDTELWLSPISVWETLILAEKGRIEFNTKPETWVKKYLRQLKLKEAKLTYEIAILSRKLQFNHQDPADRFLAATAIANNLTLATVDKRLTELDWLSTI